MTIPFTRPAEWPPVKPGRFAATIRIDRRRRRARARIRARSRCSGCPTTSACASTAGAPGAAEGPRAFRAALAAFGTTWDSTATRRSTPWSSTPATSSRRPATMKRRCWRPTRASRRPRARLHDAGYVTAGIGGGHDLGAALHRRLRGARRARRRRRQLRRAPRRARTRRLGHAVPAIDRRRPRRRVRAFVELGLGRFANDRGDVEWARAQGATLVSADAVLSSTSPARRRLLGARAGAAAPAS